ncbi:MAG: hypothetical protein ABWW70_00510 [Thermoproteota archaeon]
MPFQVQQDRGQGLYRCAVCGRVVKEPILYKTCCMNKPVAFCSRACASKWLAQWMRNQDLAASRGRGRLSMRL